MPVRATAQRVGSRVEFQARFSRGRSAVARAGLKRLAMRTAGIAALALNRAFGSRARNRAGIVTYHRVMPPVAGLSEPPDNVRPDRFRAQLVGLLRRGFNVRPLRELLDCNARGESVPPRTIAITFDDGFQSVYHYAWPVLRELRLAATVFLATAHVGAAAPFPFDPWGVANAADAPPVAYCPLTLDQCREMAATGLVDFGAHTHTHRDFRGRAEQFREDLQASVDFVQAAFGYENVMFAFPYGSRRRGFADAGLAAAAKQTGVICGLTTECSLIESASDPFQWGRFNVFPWDSDTTLAAKLNGWYVQRPGWHVPEPGHPRGASKGVGVPQIRPSLEAHSVPPCRCAGAPNQGLNTVSHRLLGDNSHGY